MWVPSHIGITENEKADKYADHETKTIPNSTINHIPINDMKNYINNKILSVSQNHWNSIPTSNKIKNIFIKTIKKMAHSYQFQPLTKNCKHPHQNRTLLPHTIIFNQ